MKNISLTQFQEALSKEGDNPKVLFADVRMPIEYKEKHIKGVSNIPLDTLPSQIKNLESYDTIYFHCLSGSRCTKAVESLENTPLVNKVITFKGGISEWEAAHLPLEKTKVTIPIMRQVMIVAGSLVLLGVILSLTVFPPAIYLAGFVGLGLLFAGLSGWCGMAKLLGFMPWNKA